MVFYSKIKQWSAHEMPKAFSVGAGESTRELVSGCVCVCVCGGGSEVSPEKKNRFRNAEML